MRQQSLNVFPTAQPSDQSLHTRSHFGWTLKQVRVWVECVFGEDVCGRGAEGRGERRCLSVFIFCHPIRLSLVGTMKTTHEPHNTQSTSVTSSRLTRTHAYAMPSIVYTHHIAHTSHTVDRIGEKPTNNLMWIYNNKKKKKRKQKRCERANEREAGFVLCVPLSDVSKYISKQNPNPFHTHELCRFINLFYPQRLLHHTPFGIIPFAELPHFFFPPRWVACARATVTGGWW